MVILSTTDTKVTLVFAAKGSDGANAERDVDYKAVLRHLTIPADSIAAETTDRR